MLLAYLPSLGPQFTWFILAEGMLGDTEYFKGGRVDRDALVEFIKDIKKNTKLSDEDAAVIATSKVSSEKYKVCIPFLKDYKKTKLIIILHFKFSIYI